MFRRTLTITALSAALALGATGCGSDEPKTQPTETTSSAPSPTPTKPAWESKFKDQELEQYKGALNFWNHWIQDSAPIWAAGKYTPEAEQLFKRYWSLTDEQRYRLEGNEAAGMKVTGEAKVLSSQLVAFNKGTMTIHQCIDNSGLTVTYPGKPETPKKALAPFMRKIILLKTGSPADTSKWKILGVLDATSYLKRGNQVINEGWKKPCSG